MKTIASVPGRRRLFAAVVVGASVALSSTFAQAGSISGTISFTGGADLNAALITATAYTGFFGSGGASPVVLGGSQTGSYAGVAASTPVTFYSFTFLPFTTSPQTLWSFTSGATTYSFKATSLTEIDQPGYLNLQGIGTASITGFADTPATWSFTDTGIGAGPGFSFGASITATPEPSTVSLLAVLPLIGLAFRVAAKRKSSLRAGC